MSEAPSEPKPVPETAPEAREADKVDEKDPKEDSPKPPATENEATPKETEGKKPEEKEEEKGKAAGANAPPNGKPQQNSAQPQPRPQTQQELRQRRGRINIPKVPNKEALIGLLETGNAKFSLLKDIMNFDNFRGYFQVSSSYVVNKLKRVLFPHYFCDESTLWAQKFVKGKNGAGECAPPVADINALDFYIPIMSFATYLLLCVLLYGLAGFYTANLFEKIATKAACVIGIEALLIKGAMYLFTDHDMSIVEIMGYCGYAFAGICLNVLVSVFLGFKMSMMVMCFFAFEMSCFLKRTFSVLIMRTSHVKERNVKSGTIYEIGSRRFFIAFVCLLQFAVSYYLSYYY